VRKKLVVVVAPRCVDTFCLRVTMTVPGEKVLLTAASRCDLCDDDGAR